jgi:hypothetical protein
VAYVTRDERKAILAEVARLLEDGHEELVAAVVQKALSGSEEELEKFLISNELWGGSGSIADQSLVSDSRRRALEGLLIRLGRLQLAAGKTNPRTAMWVGAFEKWQPECVRPF